MKTHQIYKKFSRLPFGKYLFSRIVCIKAPYFSSIHPKILEMRPGYCKVEMKERRSVRNHIGTVHAIAMCNLCETAMGMVAEATIKPQNRWIPKGMKVEYLKKAKGRLLGITDFDPGIFVTGEVDIPVEVKDMAGEVVMKANILLYVTEKPI